MFESSYHSTALQDFRRARHRADLERIVSFLKEQSVGLLSHDELYTQSQTLDSQPRQVRNIPLDAIVGKLSRDKEFTERVFPAQKYKSTSLMKDAFSYDENPQKFAPIELYQIGDSYFISDGNSRLSSALQTGAKVIEAFVIPIQTERVSSQDLQADALVLNAEYHNFVAHSPLDRLRAWRKHEITIPGKYHVLEEQLEVCRYLFCELQQAEFSDEALVLFWYDTLYLPAITLIDSLEILRDFPERTAGDLYIWVCEHRTLIRHIDSLKKFPYAAEIWAEVPSPPDMDIEVPDAQEECRNFLKQTQLHRLRPEADIPVTDPENYRILRDHIDVHRYFMGLEQKRDEVSYQEAVVHWYDVVYYPITQAIRQQHLLEYFPNHGIGDLYLWLSAYQIISRRDDVSRAEEFLTETLTALPDFSYEMLDTVVTIIEYLDFLLHTQLNTLRPKADLSVSIPGKYRVLEEHISVHRHFMGIEQQREIPYHEAVVHWYDRVYLPALKVIAEQRILRAFPDLSATSLYLWVCEHRSALEKQLGAPVEIAAAAGDLVIRFGSKKSSPLFRQQQAALDTSNADKVSQGALPLQKERETYALRRRESLFTNILLLFNDRHTGKAVLEQALNIAQREEAHITGLHVLSSAHQLYTDSSLKLRNFFDQHCHAAGVQGSFHVEVGDLRETIGVYSRRHCDLIVSNSHGTSPPPLIHQPLLERETSHKNLQFLCAEETRPLRSAFVLYDNSPAANEALFAAAYLASRWGITLTVMTSGIDAAGRTFIKDYLERHKLGADLLQQRGSLQEWLPKVMHEHDCDFLIAGSHDLLHGKQGLAKLQYPLLLCR
ncbi:MAG: universal stress protein [bacterium]|nr:universal stress protein [bacterium]